MNIPLPQLDQREKDRQQQCPHRSDGQCLEITRRVGWDVSVSIDWCDKCWNNDRPTGTLESLARSIVTSHAEPEIRKNLDRDVLETLRDKHGYDIPLDEIARANDRKQRWRKVRPTWETARSFVGTMLSSVVLGKVSQDRFTARLEACRRCPARRESAGKEYCGVCGCGDTSLAALDDKLKHPLLRCPLGRFS